MALERGLSSVSHFYLLSQREFNARLGWFGDAPRLKACVSLNVAVGRCIVMPRLAEFASAHPDIRLEVIFADSRAEFVMDKIDVAIRIGGLEDQDLIEGLASRAASPWPRPAISRSSGIRRDRTNSSTTRRSTFCFRA